MVSSNVYASHLICLIVQRIGSQLTVARLAHPNWL